MKLAFIALFMLLIGCGGGSTPVVCFVIAGVEFDSPAVRKAVDRAIERHGLVRLQPSPYAHHLASSSGAEVAEYLEVFANPVGELEQIGIYLFEF